MHNIVDKYYNPKRKIEPKRKKDWKRAYVDFYISELPGPAGLRNDSIKPGTRLSYDFIDDNFFVMDFSSSKKEYLYWGGGFALTYLLLIVYFAFRMNWNFSDELLYLSLSFAAILLLPSIWSFSLAFSLPKEKKMIFDRMRGLVQLPGAFWDEPQLVRFDEMHVNKAIRSRAGGVELVIARFRNWYDNWAGPLYITFPYGTLFQSWSFFVWYMDKNRPLPPSEALDPYRQRDYERRKKEGFPPPLFPSNISTPEHNTEEFQQMILENNKTPGAAGVTLNKLYENRNKGIV